MQDVMETDNYYLVCHTIHVYSKPQILSVFAEYIFWNRILCVGVDLVPTFSAFYDINTFQAKEGTTTFIFYTLDI